MHLPKGRPTHVGSVSVWEGPRLLFLILAGVHEQAKTFVVCRQRYVIAGHSRVLAPNSTPDLDYVRLRELPRHHSSLTAH